MAQRPLKRTGKLAAKGKCSNPFENEPSLGQRRVSDTLRQEGIFISAAGVRLRHGLETFQNRLKALFDA
jgi:hypothetical protein